jgi:hypothetical protein
MLTRITISSKVSWKGHTVHMTDEKEAFRRTFFGQESLKRDLFEGLCVGERILLKRILKKSFMGKWTKSA